jgi:hypothetical protein
MPRSTAASRDTDAQGQLRRKMVYKLHETTNSSLDEYADQEGIMLGERASDAHIWQADTLYRFLSEYSQRHTEGPVPVLDISFENGDAYEQAGASC